MMEWAKTGILIILLVVVCACIQKNKTVTDVELNRPEVFTNDDELPDYIQRTHFNYTWEGAEKTSGLACERIHLDNVYLQQDQDVITIGGSGFGIAGLLVATERNFISREEGVAWLTKIADYLAKTNRSHGVWPRWLHGPIGKVKPFGTEDDGGDLVESDFLMQSLLYVRQYVKDGNEKEKTLAARIDELWHGMKFDWYRNGDRNVLYRHWPPNYGWEMNFPPEGYNECLTTYILAASFPTHSVPVACYHEGWARSGGIKSAPKSYGYLLKLKHNGTEEKGGPLFWAHYSYIGLDPRNLTDQHANYWNVVRNHTMSDCQYCVTNPKGYKGYGPDCWGLTVSYSINGYSAHIPDNDLGMMTPTVVLFSPPYMPEESMAALKGFYRQGLWIWGKYGFYDALSPNEKWTVPHYLAIGQCMIAPTIENHRTGLLWRLSMSRPRIQDGLKKLGFTSTAVE